MSRLRVLAWAASSICAVACADTDKPDPMTMSGAGVGASAGQAGAGASGGTHSVEWVVTVQRTISPSVVRWTSGSQIG